MRPLVGLLLLTPIAVVVGCLIRILPLEEADAAPPGLELVFGLGLCALPFSMFIFSWLISTNRRPRRRRWLWIPLAVLLPFPTHFILAARFFFRSEAAPPVPPSPSSPL